MTTSAVSTRRQRRAARGVPSRGAWRRVSGAAAQVVLRRAHRGHGGCGRPGHRRGGRRCDGGRTLDV